jgi:hypothetical protein
VERCLFTRSRSDNLSSSQILREDRATTTCYTCCLGVCTSTITVYFPHSGLTDVVFGHRSSATASETTAPSPSTPPPSLSTWLSGEPPPSPPCQGCYPCLAGARTASPTTRCPPTSPGLPRHHGHVAHGYHTRECAWYAAPVGPVTLLGPLGQAEPKAVGREPGHHYAAVFEFIFLSLIIPEIGASF